MVQIQGEGALEYSPASLFTFIIPQRAHESPPNPVTAPVLPVPLACPGCVCVVETEVVPASLNHSASRMLTFLLHW